MLINVFTLNCFICIDWTRREASSLSFALSEVKAAAEEEKKARGARSDEN
jgi:hypothetical protein